MKFLLDMGIPPRARDWLREQGHARHIRDINKRAPDAEILFAARETEAIILTTDKDFGQLMAESQLALPSVILFRLTPAPAEAVIERLAPVIDSYRTELQAGCLITIALGKPRLRRLPLRRSACRRLFFGDNDLMLPERITQEPGKLGGKPCIRGMRISVSQVLAMLADGLSNELILSEYPDLEPEDIQACLLYASQLTENPRPRKKSA